MTASPPQAPASAAPNPTPPVTTQMAPPRQSLVANSCDSLESKSETMRRDDLISNAELVLKEEDGEDEEGEFRTMKDFIDLELESRNRFSFWESSASAFSKKLLKWKLKHQRKNKKGNEGFAPGKADVETESKIGAYRYLGRRSCENDRRLPMDNGRYSFDEPRASWDGYLIGKAYPRLLAPPMPIVDEKEKEKGNESEENEGGKSPRWIGAYEGLLWGAIEYAEEEKEF